MGRENINVLGRVNHLILSIHKVDRLDMVSPGPDRRRALDLHPPQPPARIHHEVVALAIAPRLGHLETQTHRLVQKRRFRKLSRSLGVA
jgi:hypothetical protein